MTDEISSRPYWVDNLPDDFYAMYRGLSDIQKIYLTKRIEGVKSTDAYRMANGKKPPYKSADTVNASRYNQNAKISKLLKYVQDRNLNNGIITRDRILQSHTDLIESNIFDAIEIGEENALDSNGNPQARQVVKIKDISEIPKKLQVLIESVKTTKDGVTITLGSKAQAKTEVARMQAYYKKPHTGVEKTPQDMEAEEEQKMIRKAMVKAALGGDSAAALAHKKLSEGIETDEEINYAADLIDDGSLR